MKIDAELAIYGGTTKLVDPPVAAPFAIQLLDAWVMLRWPGGSCAVTRPIACWGDRFAAVLCDGIAIIDGVHGRHARLEIDLAGATGLVVERGRLLVGLPTAVLELPLAALETLADTPGAVEVVARVTYPVRRPTASEEATVSWVHDDRDAIVTYGRRRLWLDVQAYRLRRGMRVTLRDELWPGEPCTIDVPGEPLRALREVETERVLAGRIVLGEPLHPLHHEVQPETLRRDRVVPLLERLADEPGDDATWSVLLDTLQDEGVPYAARLAGAKGASRNPELFAPLHRVFVPLEWHRALPVRAHLVQHVPRDEGLLAIVGRDVRLGLLREIRRGNASVATYMRVLAMPLVVGLRVVDSCKPQVLQAMIEARRDRLVALHDVAITKPRTQALLADPTFDRVRELSVHVERTNLERAVDAIARDDRGAFARAPRRLEILCSIETPRLFEIVLRRWRELPIAACRLHGVTFERRPDGIGVAKITADARDVVRRILPELDVIEG